MIRRFAPPSGFLNGADYVEFVGDATGELVWRNAKRMKGWWDWGIEDAEAHVRDGLWREISNDD
jgi:hypothetical protein